MIGTPAPSGKSDCHLKAAVKGGIPAMVKTTHEARLAGGYWLGGFIHAIRVELG